MKMAETSLAVLEKVPDYVKSGAPGAIPTRGLPLRSPCRVVIACFTRFQNSINLIENPAPLVLPVPPVQGGGLMFQRKRCLESVPGLSAILKAHAFLAFNHPRPGDSSYERTEQDMPRQRTGSVFQRADGTWWAKVAFKDETGKWRQKKRRAKNITEAKSLRDRLVRELNDHGAESLLSDRMTFETLAVHYEREYLIPPEYRDDVKIAGLRNYKKMQSDLKMLKAHFGARLLRSITYADVKNFKLMRLRGKTRRGTVRAIATVNRELSLLRRVFHIAMRHGWLLRDPFKLGEPLISTADEKHRERVLSKDEEERLLAVCDGPRAHLRPIIICALDTGMRKGEMLKLRWRDVDRERGVINIVAFNTKTMKARMVPLSARLAAEFDLLWENSIQDPSALVFGFKDVKRSFNTARMEAGIPDVRLHDCRHSFATRLIEAGMPDTMVQKLLGHTQIKTTAIYVNVQVSTVQRASALLDAFNGSEGEAA